MTMKIIQNYYWSSQKFENSVDKINQNLVIYET